jgi:uncharacterized coiled-coil protein SlyX
MSDVTRIQNLVLGVDSHFSQRILVLAYAAGWTIGDPNNAGIVKITSGRGKQSFDIDITREPTYEHYLRVIRAIKKTKDIVYVNNKFFEELYELDRAREDFDPDPVTDKILRRAWVKKAIAAIDAHVQLTAQDAAGTRALEYLRDSAMTFMEEARKQEEEIVERKVVSEFPYLGHKSPTPRGGTRYETESIVEQTWSDGTITYRCALHGCDYTSDKVLSVKSHWNSHVRNGETKPVSKKPEVVLIDPDYTSAKNPRAAGDYCPSDRLVDALSQYLAEHWSEGDDLQAAARAALRWSNERPDLGDLEDRVRPSRELNDAEILERVRMLVGTHRNPEMEARIVELEQQILSMEQELDEYRTWAALLPNRSA